MAAGAAENHGGLLPDRGQRGPAAHERAIRRHAQAAEVQERFGHPDRAATAREHARHTRELREQALRELQEWEQADAGRCAQPATASSGSVLAWVVGEAGRPVAVWI